MLYSFIAALIFCGVAFLCVIVFVVGVEFLLIILAFIKALIEIVIEKMNLRKK